MYTGGHQNVQPDQLLVQLEAARRASARVMVSLTGNEQWNRDANGFSITLWKQRVDRFRSIDFASYIEDGTIIGHLLLDEPSDPHNWNGKVVPLAEIEEMARYSKEIWPSLTTIIRAWPSFLKGYEYRHLDATWIQYLDRFGDLEEFIATRVHDAKALGLAVVGGVNAIHGGAKDNGMPSYGINKTSMSPSELRTWGGRLLSEDVCLFIIWEYRAAYFSRPEIQSALEDLSRQAKSLPKKTCRR
ncbi:MAG: hypothetical protein ACREA0_15955 [bacterium]